jgi:hypothetical protein
MVATTSYIYIYPSFDIMGNILFVCLFVCLKKGNLNILFLSSTLIIKWESSISNVFLLFELVLSGFERKKKFDQNLNKILINFFSIRQFYTFHYKTIFE